MLSTDLDELIVEHLTESKEPDPRKIGVKLAEEITPRQLRDVVRILLPDRCVELARTSRTKIDHKRIEIATQKISQGESRSGKWEAVKRTVEEVWLDGSIHVPGHGWLTRLQVTDEHVRSLRQYAYDMSDAYKTKGDQYDEVLNTMHDRGVTRLPDLVRTDFQLCEEVF